MKLVKYFKNYWAWLIPSPLLQKSGSNRVQIIYFQLFMKTYFSTGKTIVGIATLSLVRRKLRLHEQLERNYPNLKQVTCPHIYNFDCVNNKLRWEDLHDGKSLQLDINLLKNSQGIHNLYLEYTKTQENTDISWHKRTIGSSSFMAQNKYLYGPEKW